MEINNRIMNSFFTQKVFNDLVKNEKNNIYDLTIQQCINKEKMKTNNEVIKEIYNFMNKYYRNEYFYKNTLLNKLLLGIHNTKTATALTQISIGKAKADFILINGKAIVYEIKSDLDNFDRLIAQVKEYYRAFNNVCVITSESNFEKLSHLLNGTTVGIKVLTKANRFSQKLKKESEENNSYLDYNVIFRILHKREFESIIYKYFNELPATSQVFYFTECYNMFKNIPIDQLFELVIKELKKRNEIEEKYLKDIPYELRSLVYFSKPSANYFSKLNIFLGKDYKR